MKTYLLPSAILILTSILGGCKENNKTNTTGSDVAKASDTTYTALPATTTTYYFAGEYTYNNGKSSLKNCATGTTFPLAPGEITTTIEKEFNALKQSPATPVFIQVYGYLSPSNEVELHSPDQLVITQNLGLQPEHKCMPSHLLTGNYITYIPNNIKPSEKFTFTLHPDYTYTFSIYNLGSNSTRTATGTWHLLQKDYIQFTNNALTNFISEAFIDYNKMELTFKNSKRVYFRE